MSDNDYMSIAISLAKKALGNTHPNPMVGAVIVEDGKIVAEGYHIADSLPHAEKCAIKNLGRKAKDNSKIYVTLEPCSTEGRTGACTKAIIEAGIKEVIIGTLDPNPSHAGRAISILEEAGIKVKVGVLEEECRQLNFIFNYHILNKKSLLCAKFAMSNNLMLSEAKDSRTIISCEKSFEHLMSLRKLFPAIAVGFNTFISDNPKLSIRIKGEKETCNYRLLFDRSLNCLEHLDKNLFSDEFKSKTIVICDLSSPESKIKELKKLNINYLRINASSSDEKKFWNELQMELFNRKIYALLIEGGVNILNSLFSTNSANYFFVYKSPKTLEKSELGFTEKELSFLSNAKSKKIDIDTLYYGEFF